MKAIISQCGAFRYRLEREVQPEGSVFAFFGVNPSTADADLEDSTTKKWRGFCLRNGARRYIAGNAFAFRSTDVARLAVETDPVGPENGIHLQQIIADADVLIPCWGSREKIPERLRSRLDALRMILVQSGKPVRILGLTKSGDPKHPLMLGYETPLAPWEPAA